MGALNFDRTWFAPAAPPHFLFDGDGRLHRLFFEGKCACTPCMHDRYGRRLERAPKHQGRPLWVYS